MEVNCQVFIMTLRAYMIWTSSAVLTLHPTMIPPDCCTSTALAPLKLWGHTQHTSTALTTPSAHCINYSLCPEEISSSVTHMAPSFTSIYSLLQRHLLRKDTDDHHILNNIPTFPLRHLLLPSIDFFSQAMWHSHVYYPFTCLFLFCLIPLCIILLHSYDS